MADKKSDHSAGMFDLNCDGKIDGIEGYLAYRMFDRMAKENKAKAPKGIYSLPHNPVPPQEEAEKPAPPQKIDLAEYRAQRRLYAAGIAAALFLWLLLSALPLLGVWHFLSTCSFSNSFDGPFSVILSILLLLLIAYITILLLKFLCEISDRWHAVKESFYHSWTKDEIAAMKHKKRR